MVRGTTNSRKYNWDINLLTWIPDTGALLASVPSVVIGIVEQGAAGVNPWLTSQSRINLLHSSGSTSASGNTTLVTPAGGKRLRVFYLSYNPAGATEVGFRFGTAGTLILRNNITTGGSIVSKDFGEFRNITGAINEALVLNQSNAVATIWNCFYMEID